MLKAFGGESIMDGTEQGPKITFTQWGHKLESGYADLGGYAVCTQCGCTENSTEMAELCIDSAIMRDLEEKCQAALKVIKEMRS